MKMPNQTTLDFSTNVHRDDPITSYQAAERVIEFANGHYEIIFHVLLKHGGLTAEEISDRCELGYFKVSRRLNEMQKKGLIERTGEKRQNRSRYKSCVWRVK